jgi:hypothetical protein
MPLPLIHGPRHVENMIQSLNRTQPQHNQQSVFQHSPR